MYKTVSLHQIIQPVPSICSYAPLLSHRHLRRSYHLLLLLGHRPHRGKCTQASSAVNDRRIVRAQLVAADCVLCAGAWFGCLDVAAAQLFSPWICSLRCHQFSITIAAHLWTPSSPFTGYTHHLQFYRDNFIRSSLLLNRFPKAHSLSMRFAGNVSKIYQTECFSIILAKSQTLWRPNITLIIFLHNVLYSFLTDL